MSVEVSVQLATQSTSAPCESDFARWAAAAAGASGSVEVSIRIVDETESAALNARYRDKPGPTNVLAFPADVATETGSRLLGDIVICAPVVVAQAREQGKQSDAHWAHLVVHGILHLQGFTHDNEENARIMESHEVDILARLGYSNPYEAGDPAAGMRGHGATS